MKEENAIVFVVDDDLSIRESLRNLIDWNEYLGPAYLFWTPHRWLAHVLL